MIRKNKILYLKKYIIIIAFSILLCAFLIASYFINKEAKRFDIEKDFIFNLVFWTLIFGLIGARIYYVIFNLDYYLKYPVDILKVWFLAWIVILMGQYADLMCL